MEPVALITQASANHGRTAWRKALTERALRNKLRNAVLPAKIFRGTERGIEDDLVMKRLFREPGGMWFLKSDNPNKKSWPTRA